MSPSYILQQLKGLSWRTSNKYAFEGLEWGSDLEPRSIKRERLPNGDVKQLSIPYFVTDPRFASYAPTLPRMSATVVRSLERDPLDQMDSQSTRNLATPGATRGNPCVSSEDALASNPNNKSSRPNSRELAAASQKSVQKNISIIFGPSELYVVIR